MAEYVVDLYSEHDGVRCEPIVRCRDCASVCEHYKGMNVYWCDYLRMYVGSNGFCAWGKRKESE